jgi:hypothetical protein
LGTIISGEKKNFLLLSGDFPNVFSFEKAAQISFHNPIVELPAYSSHCTLIPLKQQGFSCQWNSILKRNSMESKIGAPLFLRSRLLSN